MVRRAEPGHTGPRPATATVPSVALSVDPTVASRKESADEGEPAWFVTVLSPPANAATPCHRDGGRGWRSGHLRISGG
ncbi:hypothetical protein GALL_318890 [mine drainage metagenome]|uniref:Uncharacterized protein n=1 Tax=mine drainage metagenome TaxID=410659 RepID=A0A1J5QS45_9ZZZZ